MKVEFDKISQGCDICVAKSKENCRQCERNPGLLKLKDNFKRPDKKPPQPPVKDDVSRGKISDANRAELRAWGVRIQPDLATDRFQPPSSAVEKPPDPSPPPADLDV